MYSVRPRSRSSSFAAGSVGWSAATSAPLGCGNGEPQPDASVKAVLDATTNSQAAERRAVEPWGISVVAAAAAVRLFLARDALPAQATLVRTARRFGLPTRFRAHERSSNQLRQPLARPLEVLQLRA